MLNCSGDTVVCDLHHRVGWIPLGYAGWSARALVLGRCAAVPVAVPVPLVGRVVIDIHREVCAVAVYNIGVGRDVMASDDRAVGCLELFSAQHVATRLGVGCLAHGVSP